ncbi:hypothetical protein ACHAXA_011279 [Cyclostephanos tholiformis]|uniref:Uncharacterized protein n=1 Tax=Cyclostephanos tholiformis TaxID=382380 RepID=A0ABD3RFV9_9STRA
MDDERVATEDASQETEQEQYIAKEYPHKMAGDALAIIGGILFGISNTLQEVTVKDGSLMEYLGCFTFFASIIASIQAMFFERQEIMAFYGKSSDETCSKSEGEFLFFLFAIAGMVTYAGIGAFLQFSDAAFLSQVKDASRIAPLPRHHRCYCVGRRCWGISVREAQPPAPFALAYSSGVSLRDCAEPGGRSTTRRYWGSSAHGKYQHGDEGPECSR